MYLETVYQAACLRQKPVRQQCNSTPDITPHSGTRCSTGPFTAHAFAFHQPRLPSLLGSQNMLVRWEVSVKGHFAAVCAEGLLLAAVKQNVVGNSLFFLWCALL